MKNKSFGIIVTGSRDFEDYFLLQHIMDKMLRNHKDSDVTIITGGMKGADTLGALYALERGYNNIIIHPDYDNYGENVISIRNEEMHKRLSELDTDSKGCICFWDGKSNGTKDNFDRAIKYDEQLKIYNYNTKTFYHYKKKDKENEQLSLFDYSFQNNQEEVER